jgi:hypothetical protein
MATSTPIPKEPQPVPQAQPDVAAPATKPVPHPAKVRFNDFASI